MTTRPTPLSEHTPERRPTARQPRLTRATRIVTYHDLKNRLASLKKALREAGRSDQTISNRNTALTKWMEHFGLSDGDPAGEDFGDAFEDRFAEYAGKTSGTYQPSTAKARKYNLSRVRQIFLELSGALALPESFQDAVKALMERSGKSRYAVGKASGVPATQIRSWIEGKVPPRGSLPQVKAFEAYFGLKEGTLLGKLLWHGVAVTAPAKDPEGDGEELSEYGKKLRGLLAKQYRLKPFPPKLQKEWDDFLLYKTGDTSYLKRRRLKRNERWRVRENGVCETGDMYANKLSAFFGFLCLPADSEDAMLRGLGFDPGVLSLAMLGDPDLVDEYIQFRKNRSGAHNTDTSVFMHFCKGLLLPGEGYLRQQPSFGLRLPRWVGGRDWDGWCEANYQTFLEIIRGMKKDGEFKKTRNPFKPIERILVEEHPIRVLKTLAVRVQAAAPPAHYSGENKAVHARDLLLMRFATANPLRAYNFSIMTYRPDDGGNLYRKVIKGKKAWCLRFRPEDFKNQRGAAKEPYDVVIAPSVWPYIEDYLFNHRQHLVGAGQCDYVFRPSTKQFSATRKEKLEVTDPVPPKFLSNSIRILSERHLKDYCRGFRMHAFRHIVATDYIRHHPEGYEVAAAILHDKPETVRRAYDWVKPAEKFSHWNTYHELLMSDDFDDGGGDR